MSKNYALILAAGSGNRIGQSTPKCFLKLNDFYILELCILQFLNNANIDHVILVIPKKYKSLISNLVIEKNYSKVQDIIIGGEDRFESSRLGLSSIKEPDSKVLIHDAARPFVSENIINNCLSSLIKFNAVNVLSPIADSVVQLKNGEIISLVNRDQYRQAQTPQGFLVSAIKAAHKMALKENLQNITDDYNLVMKYKTGSTAWIEGSRLNFKITYPDDLELATAIAKTLVL